MVILKRFLSEWLYFPVLLGENRISQGVEDWGSLARCALGPQGSKGNFAATVQPWLVPGTERASTAQRIGRRPRFVPWDKVGLCLGQIPKTALGGSS